MQTIFPFANDEYMFEPGLEINLNINYYEYSEPNEKEKEQQKQSHFQNKNNKQVIDTEDLIIRKYH